MIHVIDLYFYEQESIIAAFLVETSEGAVLVETGPFSTFPSLKKGLAKIGYQPEDIKHVLLTHIHLDHAGAAWWFAQHGAKIYVHPRGYKHLADPSKLMASAKMIYQDMMDTLWGRMEAIPIDLLIQVEHGEKLNIGNKKFTAWHTPGHAVHHIAWQVDKTLFSGDVGGVKVGDGPVIPPCPPPDINREDWNASIALMRTLDIDEMYLTHFDKITNIQTHLNELETRLDNWVNWMQPHFEAGTPPAEITPLFQEMAQAELKAAGITDDTQLGQYEAANPSWMSVAGLLRYWGKR